MPHIDYTLDSGPKNRFSISNMLCKGIFPGGVYSEGTWDHIESLHWSVQ